MRKIVKICLRYQANYAIIFIVGKSREQQKIQKYFEKVLTNFYNYDIISYHSDTAGWPITGGYWYAEIAIVRNDDD